MVTDTNESIQRRTSPATHLARLAELEQELARDAKTAMAFRDDTRHQHYWCRAESVRWAIERETERQTIED